MVSIAIDGPAGAGKSSICTRLAQELHYLHIDAGALYRAVGLFVLRQNKNPADPADVLPLLPQIHIDLRFEDNAAVCVVLASDGYPVSYEKGFKISGLEKFDGKDDYFCFHAGTKFDENGDIVTNGGRVLGITATGADLKEARKKAYEATEWVSFANKYMRHDIGKAIDEAE